jgi:hypothetical protein
MKKPENGEGFPKIQCHPLVLNPDSSFLSAPGKLQEKRALNGDR